MPVLFSLSILLFILFPSFEAVIACVNYILHLFGKRIYFLLFSF
jgi:hypothetical protein